MLCIEISQINFTFEMVFASVDFLNNVDSHAVKTFGQLSPMLKSNAILAVLVAKL